MNAALETSHHGFPVVDALSGKLVGLVDRDTLLTFAERPRDPLSVAASPILGAAREGAGLRPYVNLAPWHVRAASVVAL